MDASTIAAAMLERLGMHWLIGVLVDPRLFAFAAFLAAGLHGVEQKLPLQPAFQGDAYKSGEVPSVPPTLRDAVAR